MCTVREAIIVSLRDELRREVREVQAGNVQADTQQKADAVFYRNHLQPAMEQVHQYFSEVIENLNIIEPVIHPDYPFSPSSKDPVFLTQSGYKLHVDDVKEPRQVDIVSSAVLEGTQRPASTAGGRAGTQSTAVSGSECRPGGRQDCSPRWAIDLPN